MMNAYKQASVLSMLLMVALAACGGGTEVTPARTQDGAGQENLVSIAITPTDPTIAAGTSQDFVATGIYADNSTSDLTAVATWDSSDAARALFLSPGRIHGRTAGQITIRARHGNREGTTTLTVTQATLVSLAVTPPNPSLARGTTQQLIATGVFSDDTTQDLTQSVVWSSSNTGVASVNAGLLTAVATGSATVTATFGSTTASTNVTVTSAVLSSLAVTPANSTIALGTTLQFAAVGTFSDNTTQNLTTTATWNSANTAVATVGNTSGVKGLASSVSAGAATITASWGGISGSTTLTVTAATLVSIAVTPANPSIVAGTTQQFTATGTYSNGATQNLTASATWTSSNTARATVSNAAGSRGLATGVSAGSVTITAVSGAVSGSAALTVTSATLTSITLSPRNNSLSVGGTVQYSAMGTYSNGSTQDLTAVATWSSSATNVATISNAAGSKGLAGALAAGATTISAVSGGVSATTTLNVVQSGGTELAWDAPTTNTDGSLITDLAGYNIHFGTAPGQYAQYVNVGNTNSYPISALSALVSSHGTYYISVSAYDSSGNESGYSNEITAGL